MLLNMFLRCSGHPNSRWVGPLVRSGPRKDPRNSSAPVYSPPVTSVTGSLNISGRPTVCKGLGRPEEDTVGRGDTEFPDLLEPTDHWETGYSLSDPIYILVVYVLINVIC